MVAAVERRSESGALLAADEALVPERALALFTSDPHDPGGPSRTVDEETGWLLDHFSPQELRRALSGGVVRLRRDTTRASLAALAVCAGCVALAAYRVGDLSKEPGTIAVVAIALAGLALSALLFHGLRMRVAYGLGGESLLPSDLRAHLAAVDPLGETSAREVDR